MCIVQMIIILAMVMVKIIIKLIYILRIWWVTSIFWIECVANHKYRNGEYYLHVKSLTKVQVNFFQRIVNSWFVITRIKQIFCTNTAKWSSRQWDKLSYYKKYSEMWPCLFVISQIQNGVELHGTKKKEVCM